METQRCFMHRKAWFDFDPIALAVLFLSLSVVVLAFSIP
jgi:hypothetical protein